MFKLVLEKAEEPEITLPTSAGASKKQEFQKNIYFCSTDYAKTFDCVDHNKLWEILKEMGLPDHLTCLLRNLYVGQEATVINQQRQCVTISYMDNWLIIVKTNKFICLPYIFLYFLAKLKTFWNKIGEFIHEPGV